MENLPVRKLNVNGFCPLSLKMSSMLEYEIHLKSAKKSELDDSSSDSTLQPLFCIKNKSGNGYFFR